MTELRVDWDDLDVRPDGWTDYEGRPFEGWACDFYPGGQLRDETQFQKGVQTGISRSYGEDGRLLSEESFRNGSLHGFSRSWYPNGVLRREAHYRSSVLMQEKIWDEHGHLLSDTCISPDDFRLKIVEVYDGDTEKP
ncbi:MAG: hypothetical protein U0Z75_09885 [Deinococcaceae bacterium]